MTPFNLVRDGEIVDTRYFDRAPPSSPAGTWLPRREGVAPEHAWAYERTEAIGLDEVGVGWQPKPLPALKDACRDLVREKRYAIEAGGFTVGQVTVRTDPISQAKIQGAAQLFDKDPTLETIDWEARPGVWISLTQAQMTAIGVAVGRFVQRCFTRSKHLQVAIGLMVAPAQLVQFRSALNACVTIEDLDALAIAYGAPE